MTLRPATVADFPFIRALAQRPDYRPFITDDSETILSEYLVVEDCQMLIWEPASRPAGFAIFNEIGNRSGRVELMRLALVEAGQGHGRAFLRVLVDHAFGTLGAARLWLDCSGENLRAQQTYQRAGFVLEGRLRNHHHVPVLGRTIDILLYGMLRSEWEALEPLSRRT
jgi:RimJ/RimL family protein N-acetyltransferase